MHPVFARLFDTVMYKCENITVASWTCNQCCHLGVDPCGKRQCETGTALLIWKW